MQEAVIIFSIDDGRADLYPLAKEVIIPNELPVTLNITTGAEYAQNSDVLDARQLKEIAAFPFVEIANHTRNHSNEYENIRQGYLDLCDLLDFDAHTPMGLASPGSRLKIKDIHENAEALKALGVKYVRTCDTEWFNHHKDAFALTSFPVTVEKPLSLLKELADEAVQNKSCLIYLFHSVLKKGEKNYDDLWSYDFEAFRALAEYVQDLERQSKLKIMTTADYVKRLEEA